MTITATDYELHPGLNISTLLHMRKSPKACAHVRDHGSGDTAAMSLGRLDHMGVLEPDRFRDEVVVWDGGRRYGKQWDAFVAANAGKTIATAADFATVAATVEAIANHPSAAWYIETAGKTELAIEWHFGDDLCKGRLDKVIPRSDVDIIVDLKTTADASPWAFGSSAAKYDYHVRAAWYCDGYREATGRTARFVLIAVETKPPHDVVVYTVPGYILQAGRDVYQRLLTRWRECTGDNRWPGIADEELELELPRWALGESARLDDEEPLGISIGGVEV